MWSRIAIAFLFTAWLALYGSLAAQQIKNIAPITVVVTDPTGAAIPRAQVKIVSATPLGLPAQELETNESGTLAVELQPGDYEITVRALNFRTVSRRMIAQKSVAQSIRFPLQVGGCPPGCNVVSIAGAKQLFAVRGVVVDPLGAVISRAEVVFKGESGTVVAHTGMDGGVSVNLEAGKFLVTISAPGFATTKLADISVPGPTVDAFRASLEVDPTPWGSRSPYYDLTTVPAVPSALPNIVKVKDKDKDEPARTSLAVVRPANKRRSMRCLFLWRCSALQP